MTQLMLAFAGAMPPAKFILPADAARTTSFIAFEADGRCAGCRF